MDANTAAPASSYHVRSFFVLWAGQALSLLGSQIVQFALIWYLTAETGSGTVLAIASLMGLLPMVLLGPIAGALVDRWPRRWVMFWADSIVALASLLLAVLFATGQVQIWHVYAILFVRALGGAFHGPAMIASTSLMVPPDYLTRIAGLNQMLNGGLNIIAAPIGALLVEFLPMQSIMLIDVVTALFAAVPLLFIAIPQPPAKAQATESDSHPAQSTGLWHELVLGFRYVLGRSGLRALILIAVLINFLISPAMALLPLVVTEHFEGGALQLGWLNAAFGIGIILGGLLLSVWGGFKRRMVTSLAGLVVLAGAMLMLGLAPADLFPLALAAMFLGGLALPNTNGPVQATLQVTVAPEMQGRVFTLLASLATAMTPIGLLLAGPLSDLVAVNVWYVVAGITILILVAWGATNSALLNLDQQPAFTPSPATEMEVEPLA